MKLYGALSIHLRQFPCKGPSKNITGLIHSMLEFKQSFWLFQVMRKFSNNHEAQINVLGKLSRQRTDVNLLAMILELSFSTKSLL